MKPTLHTVDFIIIGGYMAFALAVGIILSRRASESSDNYFLGGRNLPWWIVGISMAATSYASDTPLAVTEMIRTHGMQRLWWFLSGCISLVVGIFLFSRLWRRAEITTDAEFYELRYEGRPAAFLRAFRAFYSGIIANFVTMGWVTLAMSSIITTLTDVNRWVAIVVCAGVALTYATFSGFYGVVVTDLVQFFVAIFGMLYLAIASWNRVGGFDVILEKITNADGYGSQTLTMFPDVSQGMSWDLYALMIFVGLLWWNDSGGYIMQRMSSCKDEIHSIKATIFLAVFQTSRMWIWVMVALVSIVLFPDLRHTEFGDTQAYPMVMNAYLPIGMKGILVTAFLAAFMSTIDTHLNWGASYIMTDIYRRFIKKQATERHYMVVTKIVVVVMMICAASLVPLMKSVTAAWQFLVLMLSSSGLIIFGRWFWWRINAFTEIAALCTSTVLAFGNVLMPIIWPKFSVFGILWVDFRFEAKIALFICIVLPIAAVVTVLTPPVSTAHLERFYRKIRPGGFWGVVSQEARDLPGKVTSVRTVADVAGGLALCFGISLGIGNAIFHDYGRAALWFGLAIVGGIWVYTWFKREVRIYRQYKASEAEAEREAGG